MFTVIVFSAILLGLVWKLKPTPAKTNNASALITHIMFIAGAFAALFIAGFLEGVFFNASSVQRLLIKSPQSFSNAAKAIFVSLTEELTKMCVFTFCVRIVTSNLNQKKSLHNDVINTAAFVFALFFATFENIAYALQYPECPLSRIATATLIHIGVGLWYPAIFTGKKQYLFFAVMLHAIYNFSTNYRLLFFTFGFVCLLLCMRNVIKYFQK